jgi:hypothetical protein
MRQDSSVIKVNDNRLLHFLGRSRSCFFPVTSRLDLTPIQDPIKQILRLLFQIVNLNVKNAWNLTPGPSIHLHCMVLRPGTTLPFLSLTFNFHAWKLFPQVKCKCQTLKFKQNSLLLISPTRHNVSLLHLDNVNQSNLQQYYTAERKIFFFVFLQKINHSEIVLSTSYGP